MVVPSSFLGSRKDSLANFHGYSDEHTDGRQAVRDRHFVQPTGLYDPAQSRLPPQSHR